MPEPRENQIVPFVHQGELLTPPGALRLTISVDPDSLIHAGQALAAALEQVKKSTAGMAVPFARSIHPAGIIIDQDAD